MSFQGAWDYSNTTDSTVSIPLLLRSSRPSRSACRSCRAAWTSRVPPTGSCLPPPHTKQAPPRSTLWLRAAMAPLRPDRTLKFKRRGKYLRITPAFNEYEHWLPRAADRATAQARLLNACGQNTADKRNCVQPYDSCHAMSLRFSRKKLLWRRNNRSGQQPSMAQISRRCGRLIERLLLIFTSVRGSFIALGELRKSIYCGAHGARLSWREH